ncbi:hypothetical protein, partial [Acrocarpospora catenulata]|uniref:hypothetical protein n=1 Tax=Acrocarpospora catenulata TaxID=2836182 RepID=UPI003558A030
SSRPSRDCSPSRAHSPTGGSPTSRPNPTQPTKGASTRGTHSQAIRLLDLVALQLHDQVALATQAGQFTPEQQRAIDQAIDRAITDLRASRPPTTTGLPAPIVQLFQSFQGPNQRFLESDDAIYPPDVARRLRPGTRVLLTCGTRDPQVPCAITDALTEALRRARTTGPGRVVLQGVDHNLRDAAHPDVLAAEALAALRTFTSRYGSPYHRPADRRD